MNKKMKLNFRACVYDQKRWYSVQQKISYVPKNRIWGVTRKHEVPNPYWGYLYWGIVKWMRIASTNKKSLRWCKPVNASLVLFFTMPFEKTILSLKKGKRLNICRSHFGEQINIVIVTPFERDIFFKRCCKRKKWCSFQVCTPTPFKMAACQIRRQVNFSCP